MSDVAPGRDGHEGLGDLASGIRRGDDIWIAGAGNGTLDRGAGNDVFFYGPGWDVLNGGPADNILSSPREFGSSLTCYGLSRRT